MKLSIQKPLNTPREGILFFPNIDQECDIFGFTSIHMNYNYYCSCYHDHHSYFGDGGKTCDLWKYE